MVKPSSISRFTRDVIEVFGFLMAQRIAASPLTPKDTTTMAKSFPGTFKVVKTGQGYSIRFRTPFYTKYVHEGTRKMKARPFVNQILNQDGERLLKQAFRIVDAKYKNK
jgi:hypothetical protein